MTGRGVLYLLLAIVAGAAAMLSFAALRDLAELCGFATRLAWLLPVVVDAGAAAGSLVWLGARTSSAARRFARRLALGLLGLSVAANALGHGLAAFVLLPPWWVVVILSGVAPAVLGAMVHLAVLVGRGPGDGSPESEAAEGLDAEGADVERLDVDDKPIPYALAPAVDQVDPRDEHGLSRRWVAAPALVAPGPTSGGAPDRAAELIAAGVGRRRLSRELGLTEYEARRLLERTRPGTDTPSVDGEAPPDHTTPANAADVPAAAPAPAGDRS